MVRFSPVNERKVEGRPLRVQPRLSSSAAPGPPSGLAHPRGSVLHPAPAAHGRSQAAAGTAAPERRAHPRRVRVAQGVYQRIDRRTGKRVPGRYEFIYRDGTGRQVWQTAKGATKADARGERAETLARRQLGQRIERNTLTVSQVARAWLERGTGKNGRWSASSQERYDRIVRRHIDRSADPTQRPLGEVKLRDLTADRVAAWSLANERTLAPTTAVIALATLNLVCRFAVRRGWIAHNPVASLEPGEKPNWSPQHVAILEGDDLARLLEQAGPYRFLFEFLAHTGLRISEALGLTWADLELDAGLIRVHRQLSRHRVHAPLKTEAARREVMLAPALVSRLRELSLASPHKAPTDLVFSNTQGRSLDYRDVGEGFRQAVKKAGLAQDGKRLSLHSLRHGFASLLIAKGLNVVFVSRQLGHANPTVTLSTYAHLFGQADYAAAAREALEASYTTMTAATEPITNARSW
jgi:integrase